MPNSGNSNQGNQGGFSSDRDKASDASKKEGQSNASQQDRDKTSGAGKKGGDTGPSSTRKP